MTQRPTYLHEVAIVLPNIIRIDVRDGAIGRRRIEAVASPPLAGSYGVWYSEGDTYYTIVGENKSYKRYADVPPINFMDRDAADNAGNWTVSGGLTVNAVHRYTTPQQQGEWAGQGGGDGARFVQMRHHLYLELDDDLVEGTEYTITFPTEFSFVDYTFTYYPIGMRCSAIAVNQVGYGQSDDAKHAYLTEWIPGYGTEGAVDFSSVTDWHILDRNGNIVWSAGAAPVERLNPSTSELGAIGMSANDMRLTSTTQPVRNVTGFTNANPCVITYTGDNLSNDMIIRIEDVRSTSGGQDTIANFNSGGSPLLPNDWVVKNVNNSGPKTFEMYRTNDTTYSRAGLTATYRSGGKIYETYTTNNRYSTYVYDLDFSAFEPSTPGVYYVYLEGVGISYPFLIDDAVHHEVAASFAAGEYHHRHDLALDGRFGYTRPAGYSGTSSLHKVYDCLCPLALCDEIGIYSGGDVLSGHSTVGSFTSPMITRNGTGAVQMDYAIGHHDAGDHDSRLSSHFRMYYQMLEFYDHFKSAAETTNWNTPKVEELYPSDTTYAGTSVLPDCMQQILWVMRSYLKGVDANGGARGGSNCPSVSTPSWVLRSDAALSSNAIYNYAPDHLMSGILCQLLAKTAICLRKHGSFETLAQYMEDKAVLCYDRFKLIHDRVPGTKHGSLWGSHSSSAVETARLAMYGDLQTAYGTITSNSYVLPFDGSSGTLTGTVTGGTSGATGTIYSGNNNTIDGLYVYSISGTFQDNETLTFSGGGTALVNNPGNPALKTVFAHRWDTHLARFIDFRFMQAAIFMYRMTGDEAYHDDAMGYYNDLSSGDKSTLINTSASTGMWEYTNITHPGVDTGLQAAWKTAIKNTTTNSFVNLNNGVTGTVGIRSHKAYLSSAAFGQNGCNWASWDTPVIASYLTAERESAGTGLPYLKQMQYAFQYLLGCNVLKRSYVTGVGIDTPEAILHTDTHMDGLPPPKGFGLYGPSNREFGGSLIFESNQPLNWVLMNNSDDITSNFNQEKEVYPTKYALPVDAHFFSIWGAIDMAEYVIGGHIGPQLAFATTLYAERGNGQTTLSTAVPTGRTRATARTQGTKVYIQSLTPYGPFKVEGVIGCDTDDTTVYWVATTSATKPTQAQVVAGQDHTGSAAIASGSFAIDNQYGFDYEFSGLDAETLQYLHLVAEDTSGALSPAVTGSATTGAYVPFAVDYRAGADDTTDRTTPNVYSFTNGGSHYSIGTANNQRKVIVGPTTRWGTNTAITPISVTIKPTGQSDVVGTLVVGKNFDGSAGGHNFVGIYEGLAIAGTTADYEVVWNKDTVRTSIDTWTVSGAQPNPVGYSENKIGTHTWIEKAVTIPTGGVAICLVQGVSGSPSGVTWTANGSSSGITEDSDELVEGTSWRSAARVTTEGTVTIRATFNASVTDSGLVIVVYEPY